MVINKIKGRKQSKDTSAVQLQDKNFSTIQYLFDWTHELCVSLHDMVSLSLHGKERGEVQGNKDYLKNRKPMTRGIQCG